VKLATDCRSKEHPRPPSSNQSKPRANLPSRKSRLHNEPEGDVRTRSIVIAGRSKVESPSAKGQPFLSLLVTILSFTPLFAQSPPASPNRPWHSPEERILTEEGKRYRQIALLPRGSGKAYSLAALIDFAESHNPEGNRKHLEIVCHRARKTKSARLLGRTAVPCDTRAARVRLPIGAGACQALT
jgi:hypothetical protein